MYKLASVMSKARTEVLGENPPSRTFDEHKMLSIQEKY